MRIHTLAPGFSVQISETPQGYVARAMWMGGSVVLRVSFAAIRRMVATLSRTSETMRALLRRAVMAAAKSGDATPVVGGAYLSEDLDDVVVGATSKRERMARRRRKRQERRKRVARRFKNSIKRIVKAVAKLKILDRIRGIMRKLQRSKLLSGVLKAAGPALGAAFGGPMGAQLGGTITQAMFAEQAPNPSAYAMGCGCK